MSNPPCTCSEVSPLTMDLSASLVVLLFLLLLPLPGLLKSCHWWDHGKGVKGAWALWAHVAAPLKDSLLNSPTHLITNSNNRLPVQRFLYPYPPTPQPPGGYLRASIYPYWHTALRPHRRWSAQDVLNSLLCGDGGLTVCEEFCCKKKKKTVYRIHRCYLVCYGSFENHSFLGIIN